MLKKVLIRVGHSEKCSNKGVTQIKGSLKKVLKRALPRLNPLKVVAERGSRSKKSSKE